MRNITVIFLFLAASSISSGCSSGEEGMQIPPDYINKVAIMFRLGPSSYLTKIDKDDLFITVLNKGDKTIQELRGNVVFIDADGNEVGSVNWIFIWENEGMEKIAVGIKKQKFRPLEAGKSFDISHDAVSFFVGKDRQVQRNLEGKWDKARVEVRINKLILKDNQE